MGFEGMKGSRPCGPGSDECGMVEPVLSEVSCAGSESSLLLCPHEEGEEVFCAPEESVLLSCLGDGNAEGV